MKSSSIEHSLALIAPYHVKVTAPSICLSLLLLFITIYEGLKHGLQPAGGYIKCTQFVVFYVPENEFRGRIEIL